MDDKIMAALWTMWGAIQQAAKVNTYDETIKGLYEISREAMIRAELIPQDPPRGYIILSRVCTIYNPQNLWYIIHIPRGTPPDPPV